MTTSVFALHSERVWPGDGRQFSGYVQVAGAKIVAVKAGPPPDGIPCQMLGGSPLSPGLIDLMVLGGFGKSILRDDPLELAEEYLRLGVTSCQLCIGTLPWDSMVQVAKNLLEAQKQESSGTGAPAARLLGLYLEGPFQQPDLTGASLRDYALQPAPATVEKLLSELGAAVTMVNVAPGLAGDCAAVQRLCAAGKVVSMAHSNAPAPAVDACLAAGTTVLGHVWDNNSGLLGDSGVQQPTIEHVALTDERVGYIHLICDGVHVDPVLVRLVLRCRGVEALCLVTDAVPRAGMPDGPYTWDDGRQFSKAGGVGRTDKGWLTGSALLLPDMLRNLVKFTGMTPQWAIATVTGNPALSLGLAGQIGLLAPGCSADLVVWNDALQVQRVWRDGAEIDNVKTWAEVHL